MSTYKRRLPWFLVGVYYLLATAGLYLLERAGSTFADIGIPNIALGGFYYFLGVWVIIGALVTVRRPENPVGWIVSFGMIAPVVDVVAAGLVSYALRLSSEIPGLLTLALAWLNWSGMPFGILVFSLVFLLSPDGKFVSNWQRYLSWITVAAFLIYLAVKVFEPGPLVIFPSLDNPISIRPDRWRNLAPLMWGSLLLLVTCYLGSFALLLLRYRRGNRGARRQLRWLMPAAIIYLLGIPLILVGEHGTRREFFNFGGALQIVAVIFMVAAVALAVLRYRLYDLDLIINRTLVYGSLSTTLALIYFLTVGLLQLVFPVRSQVAVVISTLTIAALFAPLRRWLQVVIDRRFFRRRYDAAQIMASFSETVRNQVDLDALSRALLELVEISMEPQNASLWLRQTTSRPAQLNHL